MANIDGTRELVSRESIEVTEIDKTGAEKENENDPNRLLPSELIYSEGSSSERKTIYYKLTASQMLRYEAYFRSRLTPSHVSMVMQTSLRTSKKPSPVTSIIMSGISKIFLSELIRMTVEVQEEWRHTGALRPLHFREAYRRMHFGRRRARRREQFFR